MSFEKLIQQNKKKPLNEVAIEVVKEKPKSIQITLDYGINAVNTDYLPMLMKSEVLRPHLVGFSSMNLFANGYKFDFARTREKAGVCWLGSSKKEIYISYDFIKGDDNWLNGNMQDVILHEISHAIVYLIFGNFKIDKVDPLNKVTEGHGNMFMEVCKAINPTGTCSRYVSNFSKGREFSLFKGKCKKCGFMNYKDDNKFERCKVCNSIVTFIKN
jgi:predicted SprT family Zn-dependent metalloprotease